MGRQRRARTEDPLHVVDGRVQVRQHRRGHPRRRAGPHGRHLLPVALVRRGALRNLANAVGETLAQLQVASGLAEGEGERREGFHDPGSLGRADGDAAGVAPAQHALGPGGGARGAVAREGGGGAGEEREQGLGLLGEARVVLW